MKTIALTDYPKIRVYERIPIRLGIEMHKLGAKWVFGPNRGIKEGYWLVPEPCVSLLYTILVQHTNCHGEFLTVDLYIKKRKFRSDIKLFQRDIISFNYLSQQLKTHNSVKLDSGSIGGTWEKKNKEILFSIKQFIVKSIKFLQSPKVVEDLHITVSNVTYRELASLADASYDWVQLKEVQGSTSRESCYLPIRLFAE